MGLRNNDLLASSWLGSFRQMQNRRIAQNKRNKADPYQS